MKNVSGPISKAHNTGTEYYITTPKGLSQHVVIKQLDITTSKCVNVHTEIYKNIFFSIITLKCLVLNTVSPCKWQLDNFYFFIQVLINLVITDVCSYISIFIFYSSWVFFCAFLFSPFFLTSVLLTNFFLFSPLFIWNFYIFFLFFQWLSLIFYKHTWIQRVKLIFLISWFIWLTNHIPPILCCHC